MLALAEVISMFGLSLGAALMAHGSGLRRLTWFVGTLALASLGSVVMVAVGANSLSILAVLLIGCVACVIAKSSK